MFAAAAKSLQSCPTLCNPIDSSPPGSPVPGILQARTLEWVAISFSNAWKWKMKVKLLSRVPPLATPWTTAHQAPPPMGVSRQEYWSGVPLPSPNYIPTSNQIVVSRLLLPPAAAKSLQSGNPINCSSPGSSVHEILQARILEWIAIPFSRSSPPRDPTGCLRLTCTDRRVLYH